MIAGRASGENRVRGCTERRTLYYRPLPTHRKSTFLFHFPAPQNVWGSLVGFLFPRGSFVSSAFLPRGFWDRWETFVVQINFDSGKFDFPCGNIFRVKFRFFSGVVEMKILNPFANGAISQMFPTYRMASFTLPFISLRLHILIMGRLQSDGIIPFVRLHQRTLSVIEQLKMSNPTANNNNFELKFAIGKKGMIVIARQI